jgi:hypothetical protein
MGYQESFIFTNTKNIVKNNDDVETILNLFKDHDVRTHDDELASCVAKIIFLKKLGKFKEGMQILWITGERSAQRHSARLFDLENYNELRESTCYTEDEKKLIESIDIIFIDNISSYLPKITYDSKYVTIEDLIIESERPINYNIVEKLFTLIKPNQVENDYSGFIFGLDSYDELDGRIRNSCTELNLPLFVEESITKPLNVPCYSYSINNCDFASYHDTPHLEKKGSWTIDATPQNMRKIARAI